MSRVFAAQQTTRKNETDQYNAMQTIRSSEDPLQWWMARRDTLPMLAEMARKYLAIPATSVPCERLFSESGNVMTKKRTRLGSQTFSKIVFCRANERRYKTMFPDVEDIGCETDETDE